MAKWIEDMVVSAGKLAGATDSCNKQVTLLFPGAAVSLDEKRKREMFLEEHPLHSCQQTSRVTQILDTTEPRISCSQAAPVCHPDRVALC